MSTVERGRSWSGLGAAHGCQELAKSSTRAAKRGQEWPQRCPRAVLGRSWAVLGQSGEPKCVKKHWETWYFSRNHICEASSCSRAFKSGLGAVLGRLGVVLGWSWHLLGWSRGVLGRSWGVLGPSWGALGPSWCVLCRSWVGLESCWGGLEPSWGGLGAILGVSWASLGAILGASWGDFGNQKNKSEES